MRDIITGVVVGLMLGCFITVVYASAYSYKRGQIDAINGAVYYKLEKQLDGSTGWENQTEIVKPE